MKETEFNLLDEGWILARKDDCTVDALSLTDAILRSHEYSELSGELPTQDVSILRLMLAVLHTVFSRYAPDGEEAPICEEYEALDRWSELWKAGRFPEKPIRDYLESWHERFWLFHPERPFYQSNAAEKGTEYFSAKLNGTVSESSNKVRLFAGCSGTAKNNLSYPEAARWLLYVNNYDDTSAKPKGKNLPSPGAGWLGKLGLITVSGNSLFETLMLNLILLSPPNYCVWEEEKPIWETDKPRDGERVRIAPPDNLSELYTLQSRRLKLVRENDTVTGYTLLGGDFFDNIDAFIEPMTLWNPIKGSEKIKTQFKPKRHDSSVQMWREFSAAFNFTDSEKSRKPGIVSWITHLKSKHKLDSKKFIRFAIASVQYGDKDFFVNDLFSDSITFHTDLLTELGRHWQERITEEIGKCDELAKTLGFFAKDLELAAGASTETAGGNSSVSGAKERFYYEIDIPFREWLKEIDPEWEIDSEEEHEALKKWHSTAASAALRIGRELVVSAGTAATVGRYIKDSNEKEYFYSSADAFRKFRYQIGRIYPKKDKPKEKQV